MSARKGETMEDHDSESINETKHRRFYPRRNMSGGLILVIIGVIFLINEFVPSLNFGRLWPLILIAIGVGMLMRPSGRH